MFQLFAWLKSSLLDNINIFTICGTPYMWIPDGVLHDIFPVAIDCLEEPSFFRHLLHNVFWWKNWLQIEPLCLYFQPFINCLLYVNEALFPLLEKTSINNDLKTNFNITCIVLFSDKQNTKHVSQLSLGTKQTIMYFHLSQKQYTALIMSAQQALLDQSISFKFAVSFSYSAC